MKSSLIREKLRNFFLMKEAIAEADQQSAAIRLDGVASARSARALLATAETLEDLPKLQIAGVALLHAAAGFAAEGLVQRRQLVSSGASSSEIWAAAGELSEVQAVLKELSTATRERMVDMLKRGVPLEHGDWSESELRAMKQALLQVVRHMVLALEDIISVPMRLRAQRAKRWILTGAALLVFCALATYVIWAARDHSPVNLALNAKVTMSSNYDAGAYPPSTLVDGNKTTLGCHSEGQLHPWALIDLGGAKKIQRVVVTNRLEGLTDRAVPLLIETSTDGQTFSRFAQQDVDFKTWTATAPTVKARYVRLTVPRQTLLHLNEVEVY